MAASVQLCVAVLFNSLVQVLFLLVELYLPGLERLLRKVQSLVFGNSEGDAVFFLDQAFQVLVSYDFLVSIASHDCIPAAELEEVITEYSFIQEAVL